MWSILSASVAPFSRFSVVKCICCNLSYFGLSTALRSRSGLALLQLFSNHGDFLPISLLTERVSKLYCWINIVGQCSSHQINNYPWGWGKFDPIHLRSASGLELHSVRVTAGDLCRKKHWQLHSEHHWLHEEPQPCSRTRWGCLCNAVFRSVFMCRYGLPRTVVLQNWISVGCSQRILSHHDLSWTEVLGGNQG